MELQTWKVRPLKVIIPIEGWNRVSEPALRFALRISDDVTAVHVTREMTDEEFIEHWRTRIEAPARAAGLPQPRLEIIYSPYRTLFEPLVTYINSIQGDDPDRLIAVVVPELVKPRWWEYLLHNHVAAVLKARLLLNGHERVVVITTPWYLCEDRGTGG